MLSTHRARFHCKSFATVINATDMATSKSERSIERLSNQISFTIKQKLMASINNSRQALFSKISDRSSSIFCTGSLYASGPVGSAIQCDRTLFVNYFFRCFSFVWHTAGGKCEDNKFRCLHWEVKCADALPFYRLPIIIENNLYSPVMEWFTVPSAPIMRRLRKDLLNAAKRTSAWSYRGKAIFVDL